MTKFGWRCTNKKCKWKQAYRHPEPLFYKKGDPPVYYHACPKCGEPANMVDLPDPK
jgi:hypothetical protein